MIEPSDENGDAELEYTTEEIEDHFHEFWEDTLPELEKFGDILYIRIVR